MPTFLIPKWAPWAAIGVLLVLLGLQEVRVASVKVELAHEVADRAQENAMRWRVATVQAQRLQNLQAQHAVDQQKELDRHEKTVREISAERYAAGVRAERMRIKSTVFTTVAQQPGEVDSPSCVVAKHRLQQLGALEVEGSGLLDEAREIIRERDSQVVTLLGVIRADRAACSAPPSAAGPVSPGASLPPSPPQRFQESAPESSAEAWAALGSASTP